MNKIDLGQTIGILANLGVIAGIVFLGLELQQNNALQQADAQRARASLGGASYEFVAMSSELASILLRDTQGEALTDLELVQVEAFWTRALMINELTYLQAPQTDLIKVRQRLRRLFELSPALRDLWDRQSDEFDDRYVDWINANVMGAR